MIIKIDDINLNNNQILKYLGYTNDKVDNKTLEDIKTGIKHLLNDVNPKYIYKTFKKFKVVKNQIHLNDNFIIESEDLSDHLKNSKAIVVFALTLGVGVDQLIKKEMLINPSKGIILDAIASELIEKVANKVCFEIISNNEGYRNTRFSPGYGDLSLKVQEKIIKTLDAERKIGLYSNDSYLLLPSKSITAFFGLFDNKQRLKKSCANCRLYNNCRYREEGVFCYDQSMEK